RSSSPWAKRLRTCTTATTPARRGAPRVPTASCAMSQPDDFSKVVQDVAERSSRILGAFAQTQSASLSSAARDDLGIAKAYMDLYSRMAADPNLVASLSVNWWLDAMRLWQSSWMKAA